MTSSYCYNADGQRVRRTVGSTTTWLIYDAVGRLVAEYPASGGTMQKEYIYKAGALLATIEPSGGTKYAAADHLGTPRVWTNGGGAVITGGRHDYAPFGEELYAGTRMSGGSGQYSYEPPVSNTRQRFVSKERDSETGLDFFGARYYGSTQGRFTSPDPFEHWMIKPEQQDAYLANPQRWNRYTYVLNNPLRYTDPNGMAEIPVWDDLDKKLRQDLQKRGLNQETCCDRVNSYNHCDQWTCLCLRKLLQ